MVLLVRGVVLLTAKLYGDKDFGGQMLGLDVLDAVIATGAYRHIRGVGGSGVGRGSSIKEEHWQK